LNRTQRRKGVKPDLWGRAWLRFKTEWPRKCC